MNFFANVNCSTFLWLCVYLKRLPRPGMIHAFENCHGMRFGMAEVQRDISQLIFLLQRYGQSDVLNKVNKYENCNFDQFFSQIDQP